MVSNNAKLRTIHALMANAGLLHSKKDIIYHAYQVESTTDLSPDQMDELIHRLRQIATRRKSASEEIRKKRSIVLRIMSRMGIMDTADPSVWHVPTDWKRVNAYLADPRICGRILYELDAAGLDALARKLRSIERKNNEIKIQNEWLARNN